MSAESAGNPDAARAAGAADPAVSADDAFAAVFDAAAELDFDDATRIVRRGEDTPALDEETRIVSRPAPLPDRSPEPDVDEGTRIVARGDRPAPPADGSSDDALDEETTRPVRRARRHAVADVSGPPPQPTVAAPSPAPMISTVPGLESGQREAYPPRPLPEQQPLQRFHVDAVSRDDASAAPRGARALRVALTVLAVIVGAAALGAAIVAVVLLLNTP